MAEEIKKQGRGGDRGGRRPETDRKFVVTMRISKEAKEKFDQVSNKSKWLDDVIKKLL
jgi:hypothetical protein